MAWFKHKDSGQVFEAVGVWEDLARANARCEEVPAPTKAGKQKNESTPEANG